MSEKDAPSNDPADDGSQGWGGGYDPYRPDPSGAESPYGAQHGQPTYGQSPYGQPAPGAPAPWGGGYPGNLYGVHPITGVPYSDKSKTAAGLLQLLLPFVGVCGIGRIYAQHTAIGVVQLVGFLVAFCGFGWILVGLPFAAGIWLWSVIDAIIMLSSDAKDAQGRLLR